MGCCGSSKNTSDVVKVEGMTCGHCKMAVEKAAKSVNGVTGAEAIEAAGYHVVA